MTNNVKSAFVVPSELHRCGADFEVSRLQWPWFLCFPVNGPLGVVLQAPAGSGAAIAAGANRAQPPANILPLIIVIVFLSLEMNQIERPPGILANALWEIRTGQNGKDPPVPPIRRRAHSMEGRRGLLAVALKEMNATLKELEADREQQSTRIGILGTALEEMKSTTYKRPETQEKIRPKSANHKGMIALLLENQDEEELEKLGMKVCQAFLERSVEILYMAKQDQWQAIESELNSKQRSDFSMADQRVNHILTVSIRQGLGVAPIADKLSQARVRWYGGVLRANDDTVRKIGFNIDVPGKRPKGRIKQRRLNTLPMNSKEAGFHPDQAFDRAKWRHHTRGPLF
ncbi:unnamed protein product [Heligmosomoides polygyrus]|uniref:Uncharacterized protein n=1 Tax=Heligmosomoides polygyrus TaxID=6339 RepID=A0A3P8B918_HELPZ|nr:unnamed protein product [Heligmosomoides polygyrus]